MKWACLGFVMAFGAAGVFGAERNVETKASGADIVVAERLRNDPLMMPYYTGSILPTPQKVDYKDEFLLMANVAIVVGKDVENPDPLVEVLKDRITRYGGRVAVVASPGAEHTATVSLGDTDFARGAKDLPAVPEKEQGYLIAMTQAGGKTLIVLKGRDRLGLLWSIASLMQLIHWRDGQTMARAATVVDYPCLLKRGMILAGGDFFRPSTKGERKQPDTKLLLQQNRQLMLVCKINEPVYQKLLVADCYDYYWKHPDKMPPDAHIAEDISALGQSLTPLGITWWGGLRPHAAGASSPEELSRKVSGDEESVSGLLYYGRLMEKAGGHLCILLDDIRFPLSPYDKEHHGTARVADTWFITRVMAQLNKEYPKARLLVCPPFYWGPGGKGWQAYGEDREEYLKMIGKAWPPEVDVFWSGSQVNGASLGSKEHIEWWSTLTRRKPYLWQNSSAYSCHLYRRHYPTDPLDPLWQRYWDGFMESIGWYGFNGENIARYGVTDAISADFQWNPQVYVKDQRSSAERSVQEAAEKFIGKGSWPLLKNVIRPLSYFDSFISDRGEGQADLDRKAARGYDVLESKRAEIHAAFKVLKEKYPAPVQAWSALEGFIGVADYVDAIKADPKLNLYRVAVAQCAQALKAGHFDPERDVFLAAADIGGGVLDEVAVTVVDDNQKQPACVLDGLQCSASAEFPLTGGQASGPGEVLIYARNSQAAGRMTMTLNGKPVFDGKAPFGKLESTVVRFPVPAGLASLTNRLTVTLATEDRVIDFGAKGGDQSVGDSPPLAIHYAVFRGKGESSSGHSRKLD